MDTTDFLSLAEAAQHVPGRPDRSTLWRWCREGVIARDGTRIYLPHCRFGARVYVKLTDLESFARAIAIADRRGFKQRRRARSQAKRKSIKDAAALD